MASNPSKPKRLTFSFVLLLIALLFFTINYLKQMRNEFRSSTSYSKIERKPEWFEAVARELGDKNMKIGLVNMDRMMVDRFQDKTELVKVHFDKVAEDVKWSKLFPSWIDEKSPSKCPEIPMPRFEDYEGLDVVVARVPCSRECESRDVIRLQVNLVVANLLVRSGRKLENGNTRPVFAVFIGSCGPMWEIFTCDELLWHGDNSWIYKPNLRRIKQKLIMPVGTCQLAPPFSQSGEELWRRQASDRIPNYNSSLRQQPREAYVTVLHSSETYVCGAIALAQSIILSNTTKDLILLADDHITPKSLHALRSAGWKTKRIERIRSPYSKKYTYNEWNYSKLRIWQLKEYDKLLFIDSDFIVTKNLDEFFVYPQLSAAGNDRHLFNSGLMLIEPSECMFRTLMKKRLVVESYNGGDQGFLNEMFTWWHRLPAKVNRLKYFDSADDQSRQMPHDAYATHFLGQKPWVCYRDYDCNWDRLEYQQYASDSANELWWHVYDAMPAKLRKHCALTPAMKGRLLMHRSEAEQGNYPVGHWKIKVRDPRRHRRM